MLVSVVTVRVSVQTTTLPTGALLVLLLEVLLVWGLLRGSCLDWEYSKETAIVVIDTANEDSRPGNRGNYMNIENE